MIFGILRLRLLRPLFGHIIRVVNDCGLHLAQAEKVIRLRTGRTPLQFQRRRRLAGIDLTEVDIYVVQTHVHIRLLSVLVHRLGRGDLEHDPRPVRIRRKLQFKRFSERGDRSRRSQRYAEKEDHDNEKYERKTRDFSEIP